MALWLTRPVEDWHGYDMTYGVVVRADTEERARFLAAGEAGDEGHQAWMDPARTYCIPVVEDGPPVVIIRDFHAG